MALGGDLVVRLGMDSTRFSRGLGKARSALGGFVSFAARAVTGFAVTATAVMVPVIKLASDLEETMNKFNVVFGDAAKGVKAWGDEFAAQVGRSKEQIARFLAGTQDLFVPLGFDPKSAEKMSKIITSLSVDLASFNNMADDDTLRDLQAALTGSGEVMKKYGVIVSEAAVKQQALNMGWNPKELTEQQKVLARLQIILQGTTAAQGDALRSAEGLANQMKRLKAGFNDAATEFGVVFLPMVTKGLQTVNLAVKVAMITLDNFKLVWGIAKEEAINAIGAIVYRMKWFVGTTVDVLAYISKNWKNVFLDIANFGMKVFENLAKNLQSVSKSFVKSALKGFKSVPKTEFTSLTEGFESSLKGSLELRDFEPPKMKHGAIKRLTDEIMKNLGLGKSLQEEMDLSLDLGGKKGGIEEKKDIKPQGPSKAISAFSAEGFEKILTAMTGGKRPEEMTAKNTGSIDKTLKSIDRKMDAGGGFQVAGATV